jgi:GAF domain
LTGNGAPTVAENDSPIAARGIDTVRQLRLALERAAELSRALENNLAGDEGSPDDAAALAHQREDLKRRLREAEDDREELIGQMVEAEHRAGKLMNLYVATYQLHSNLDPTEVQNTIAEIARDLLGAERFVLLLKEEESSRCEIALSFGLDEVDGNLYRSGFYEGGDPLVDQTLEDGILRLAAKDDDSPTTLAAVPLRVEDSTVGALVILELVPQRLAPLSEDREILDLIAAHAASALFAARICSNADRKVRTLESLVKLMRGQ